MFHLELPLTVGILQTFHALWITDIISLNYWCGACLYYNIRNTEKRHYALWLPNKCSQCYVTGSEFSLAVHGTTVMVSLQHDLQTGLAGIFNKDLDQTASGLLLKNCKRALFLQNHYWWIIDVLPSLEIRTALECQSLELKALNQLSSIHRTLLSFDVVSEDYGNKTNI